MRAVLLTLFMLAFIEGFNAQSAQAGTEDDEDHPFPVDIGAEGHIVQGRVHSTASAGTLVPYDIIEEGQVDSDKRKHLRVEIRRSSYTRPHVYHPDIKINTSDPSNPQFDHPIIEFPNNTLPPGMEFVVVHSNAFYINEDRYIVVNDFSELEEEEGLRIKFEVILKDTLSQVHYVSNHLPFVVEIEFTHQEHNADSALFAGVLIITIVAISLLIPFVVRAKRRSKAGKPICGCGSAEDDNGSTGSGPTLMKGRQMSVGGKDNLAMILNQGGYMQHRPSVGPHTSIQNAMLRSTSNINFQPHWMDPHYMDVYDRPEYYNNQGLAPNNGQLAYQNGYVNPAFIRGVGSSRSSLDSRYEVPVNFNPYLMQQAQAMRNGGHGNLLQPPSRANGKIPANQREQQKDQQKEQQKEKVDSAVNGDVGNSRKQSLANPPKVTITDVAAKERIEEEATGGAAGGQTTFTVGPPNHETVTSEKL